MKNQESPRVIYKYPLRHTGRQELQLPKQATILTVQPQHENLCLWALVEPDQAKETRTFMMFGTGQPFHDMGLVFIGTVVTCNGTSVWHVFEKVI